MVSIINHKQSVMNNPFVISEINKTQSPLAELSKSFDTLPDRELNKSLGTKAMGMIPRNGGEWTENPGDSVWKPNREVVPNDRNYSNPEGKTWGEILDKYEVDGIPFHEGEPDFSEVSKGTVEIDDFSDVRYGAGANFDQADEKLAQERGCSKEDVFEWRKENHYTWHERSDCKTMDKVPREVHGNVPHSGGISKMRNQ